MYQVSDLIDKWSFKSALSAWPFILDVFFTNNYLTLLMVLELLRGDITIKLY